MVVPMIPAAEVGTQLDGIGAGSLSMTETGQGLWAWLAAGVAVFHGGYLVYQLFGGFLALLDRRWLLLHMASLVWGVTVVAMQWRCPLTRLEKTLYARSGEAPYQGSFLDHYVYGALLPDGSQPYFFGAYLAIVLLNYAWLARAWRRTSHRQALPSAAAAE